MDPVTGQPLDVGNVLEEPGASKKSAGFFHKGLLQALESDHRAGGRATEVKVVANGHQHSTSRRPLGSIRWIDVARVQILTTASALRAFGSALAVEGKYSSFSSARL